MPRPWQLRRVDTFLPIIDEDIFLIFELDQADQHRIDTSRHSPGILFDLISG